MKCIFDQFQEFCDFHSYTCRWGGGGGSGGAMVLGKLPVPGRPTIWISVGQGPTALAVGAGGGCFGHCYSHLFFSLLFLPLFGSGPDIDD